MKHVQVLGEDIDDNGTNQRADLCRNTEPEQPTMARRTPKVVTEQDSNVVQDAVLQSPTETNEQLASELIDEGRTG